MKKGFLAALLVAGISLAGRAGEGDPSYPVFMIPKDLMQHASAVVRVQEEIVNVSSYKKYSHKVRKVITILDESADELASQALSYSKLTSVGYFNGTLYDALGNKIRSFKKNEVMDVPAEGGGAMVNDFRVKYHSFHYKNYPYTVEYEYELESTITMFIPAWRPFVGKGISVQESKFTISTDKDVPLNRWMMQCKLEPEVVDDGKRISYRWSLKNQAAYPYEYAAPSISDIAPVIRFTVGTFRLGEFEGSMKSWESLSSFFSKLREGLDELPEEGKKKVHSIADAQSTTEAKAIALYRYLQQNTHYMGIQLGIGGWKPHPASYVAANGYGDCKALSNYMVAMLKEVGIPAYYAIIRAGKDEDDQIREFPNASFNHVICAVPLQKDTLWLECTDQTNPPGYCGSFTGNRHALIIKDNGGKLVYTRRYGKQENQQIARVQAVVTEAGNLEVDVVTRYTGELANNPLEVMTSLSKDEQRKTLKSNLDIPSYDINSFRYEDEQQKNLSIREELQLKAEHYAQVTGKRLFVTPNIMNKWNRKLLTDSVRRYWLDLRDDYAEIDTIRISVPAGYQMEATIKPLDLTTPFGAYKVSAAMEGNTIVYLRRLTINRGRFEASQYNDLAKFYEQMYKSDRSKIVLVKNE